MDLTPQTSDAWLEAETALGYHAFYGLHLRGIKKLVVIHGPGHRILSRIAHTYQERGAHVTRWHSVYDPACLTGVTLPESGTAWISGEVYQRVSVAPHITVESLKAGPELPYPLSLQIRERQTRIRRCLAGAATAHSEYESLCLANVKPDIEAWARHWRDQLLGGTTFAGYPLDIHSFGNPLTADGPHQDFIARQFSRLALTVHLVDGLPGLNSRLIRRLGEMALVLGHTVHFFHDALEPSQINHVIFPELDIGVTDATAPYAVPGGCQRLDTSTEFGRDWNVDEAEAWWTVYQKLYSQAWRLLDDIRRIRQSWAIPPDADIERLASWSTASA